MNLFKKDEIHLDGDHVIYGSKDEQEVICLDGLLEAWRQLDLGVGLSQWLVLSSTNKRISAEPKVVAVDQVLTELNRKLKYFPKVASLESLIEEDLAWGNVPV